MHMDAELLLSQIDELDGRTAFQQLVVWRVPAPVRGSMHSYKYRFALVVEGECVLRYDNEAGKGDHKHVGNLETAYRFVDLETLLDDFAADVRSWMNEHRYR